MKRALSFFAVIIVLCCGYKCIAQQNQILCYHIYKSIDNRTGMIKSEDRYTYIHFYGQYAYFTDIIDGKEVEKTAAQINIAIMKKMETTRDGCDVYWMGTRVQTSFSDYFSPYPDNILLSGTLKVSRDKQLINWTEGFVNVMSVGELVDRPVIKQSMVR